MDLMEFPIGNDYFRSLVQRLGIGVACMDASLRIVLCNPSFALMFGPCGLDALPLAHWLETNGVDSGRKTTLIRHISQGVPDPATGCITEFPLTIKDEVGSPRTIVCSVLSLDGGSRALVCEDVSELFVARSGQRESEERYRGLLEHLTDLVYTIDTEGTILSVNRAAANSLGYETGELIGKHIEQLVPEPARKQVRKNIQRVFFNGYAEGISQVVAKDGSLRYFEYRSTAISTPDRPQYVVGIGCDITERVRMKRALKESETKFQMLVENAHDGIAYVDEGGVIQFTNQRMREILKDPDPEGKPLSQYYDEENQLILEEKLLIRRMGEKTTYFITLTDADGGRHDLVVSGTPHFDDQGAYRGAMGIFTDISALRKLEAQLQQAQKMEALGTLAGGIAHDFNNILSGVLGYASLLHRHLPDDSPTAHFADMIIKSAERGAALSGQLLAFSRKGTRALTTVNFHQLVDNVVNILTRTLDPRIAVLSKKDAPMSAIAADPGQIEQALMNLCINAVDAMPQGGRLLITTDLVEVDEKYCASRTGLDPGTHLRITVQDTGEGMPKHILRRVFEPFFTTKGEGQGTGLGLSMVYGTVKSHSGHVDVYSEPNRGTAFKILLPIKGDASAPVASPNKVELANGTGTILVVDDEGIVREVLSDMLREMGYTVLTAQDGQEGLDIYRECRDEIDLVIMDMIMPRLNGKEAFAEMKKINPALRAILSTGFCQAAIAEEVVQEGIVACVQKPFHMEELSRAIAQALSS